MDAWLRDARDTVARTVGIAPAELELSDDDAATLLELARIAAHDSGERINAPLLCYLVGRAQGSRSLDELAAAIRSTS